MTIDDHSVSQAVHSISFAAHTGLANLERRPERIRVALEHILSHAETAFRDIWSLIFQLRTELLARHGLVIASKRQAKSMRSRERAEIHFDCLEVRDDEKGFDPDREYAGHLGLHVMRERAEQLGGRATISSMPRGRTTVGARLPIARP